VASVACTRPKFARPVSRAAFEAATALSHICCCDVLRFSWPLSAAIAIAMSAPPAPYRCGPCWASALPDTAMTNVAAIAANREANGVFMVMLLRR